MSFLLVRLYEFFLTVPRNGLLCSFFPLFSYSFFLKFALMILSPLGELAKSDDLSSKSQKGQVQVLRSRKIGLVPQRRISLRAGRHEWGSWSSTPFASRDDDRAQNLLSGRGG